ncbi:SGNH/GDSL hydrolase family protein [Ruminococcaceae bacterium OttesenSCG-928-D13]|nr:SGNH/GDSL hydrolase family protein [Ruminococcaceae bacterium OttesenSCG-928-D13]
MPQQPKDTNHTDKGGAPAPQPAKKQVYTAGKTSFERPGASRPGAAKPGPEARKAAAQKKLAALSRQNKIVLGVGAGGLALLLTVLLVVALAPPAAEPLPVSSLPAVDLPASGIAAESLPDKLSEDQFIDTVLPESEDAGIEYCEETLFLGDSNTERMMYYSDVTGVRLENCIGVASMGITTFTTSKCAQFQGHSKAYTMPEAVGVVQPKRVVITFGTNNAGMEIETFTGYYRDALDAVKAEYPYCDIIIGAVFPVDQYRQNTAITMASIDKMNVALATLAEQEDVKFLNWYEAILDEEIGYSGFEYTIQDGVHLTRKGMEAIFGYFRTHAYITEDARPALKPVPARIGIQPGTVTQDPYKYPGPFDWSKYEDKSSSASAGETVSVVFKAWDQTNKTQGGGSFSGAGSGAGFTLKLKPGAGTGQVTVKAAEGYEFVGWNATAGSTANADGKKLDYKVPTDAEPGTTITVTAVFKLKAASASSDSSDSSSSSSSTPASSSDPSSSPPDPSSTPGESSSDPVSTPAESLPQSTGGEAPGSAVNPEEQPGGESTAGPAEDGSAGP